jgi:adenylate kinase family enzyme
MKRIVVVGVAGSGKTTTARRLSGLLNSPHIELDSLHWLPDWQERTTSEFRAKLADMLLADRWVVDGNYSKARDVVWPQADTLVWLDYPLWRILWQLLRRTIQRIVSQENLWNTGNKETWRKQFLSRESLFLWALKTYRRRKQEYPTLLKLPENAHLKVIRLRSTSETESWLRSLKENHE